MKNGKIIFIEPEHKEASSLKNTFEKKGISDFYELKFIEFDFNLDKINLINKTIKNTVKEIAKNKEETKVVLVDVRILENEHQDVSGVDIASKLKENFPDIPVFNITNYYQGDDLFLFGKSSVQFTDGILPKSLFYDQSFSKNEFDRIIALANNKISKMKEVVLRFGKENKEDKKTNLRNEKFDIAVITALKDPEFEAFKYFFKPLIEMQDDDLEFNDTSKYYSAEVKNKNTCLKIVACTDDNMGMPSTTSLATRMIHQFQPSIIVLLGICAGVEEKTKIGDILVASLCWDYGSGKFEKELKGNRILFKPSPETEKLDTSLKNKFIHFSSEELLSEIKKTNEAIYVSNNPLKAYVKPFASGSSVIESTEKVKEIKQQHRKLYGFDMEAYGIFYAASATYGNTKAISVKAVADFGTEEKNTALKKQHQLYAARNSALFFKKFCERILLKSETKKS